MVETENDLVWHNSKKPHKKRIKATFIFNSNFTSFHFDVVLRKNDSIEKKQEEIILFLFPSNRNF